MPTHSATAERQSTKSNLLIRLQIFVGGATVG